MTLQNLCDLLADTVLRNLKDNMWSYVANLNETDLMKLPISIQLKIFFYEWENI